MQVDFYAQNWQMADCVRGDKQEHIVNVLPRSAEKGYPISMATLEIAVMEFP